MTGKVLLSDFLSEYCELLGFDTYMLHESILNTETFEAPVFKMDGGFDRFNKKFGGTLVEIIREINTYIYEGVA